MNWSGETKIPLDIAEKIHQSQKTTWWKRLLRIKPAYFWIIEHSDILYVQFGYINRLSAAFKCYYTIISNKGKENEKRVRIKHVYGPFVTKEECIAKMISMQEISDSKITTSLLKGQTI